MRTPTVGRRLRAYRPTARLLTEYWLHALPRRPGHSDLRACLEHALPGSLAIDVGASVGNYAAAISRKVGPKGQVLALEPNVTVFEELVRSTWATNVVALNLAASSTVGEATLSVPVSEKGHQAPLGTLQPASGSTATQIVRSVPLDHLVERNRPVSLIKIDVEGHEAHVIDGARQTIALHAPTLVIEVEARHTSPNTLLDTITEVMSMGYQCTPLCDGSAPTWLEFDVHEHQTRHLSPDGDTIRKGHDGLYVNNFLFTALAPATRRDA